MSKTTYAMFKVYDYKGGELSSSVKLNKQYVGEALAENHYGEVEMESIATKQEVLNHLEENPIEADLYSSCDSYGFTGEIYKVTDGEMKQVELNHFYNEIADALISWK